MTEYETASLVLVQQGNLIALFVGLVQAGLIAGGLWIVRKTASNRDDLHRETIEALRQQGEALHALIERTAPPVK